MNEILAAVYIIMLFAGILWLLTKHTDAEDDEESAPDDFAFLTVREQIDAAKDTADMIGEMEQLLTDMELCSEDAVLVLHVEWGGRDGENHAYDLFCAGDDTATVCMSEIAERERHDLRQTLACQCAMLSEAGRHRQNHRQNDREAIGEDAVEEIMSAMRGSRAV